MKTFDRNKYIEEDCLFLSPEEAECCQACPYVVYDNDGYPKCNIVQYASCEYNKTRNPIMEIVCKDNDKKHDYNLKLIKNSINRINAAFNKNGYIYLHDIIKELRGFWDPHNDNRVFIKGENEYKIEIKDNNTFVIVYVYSKDS